MDFDWYFSRLRQKSTCWLERAFFISFYTIPTLFNSNSNTILVVQHSDTKSIFKFDLESERERETEQKSKTQE